MYYVIHARKAVLLVIILVLIGVTFWAGFYGRDPAVDVDTGLSLSSEPESEDGEPVDDVFAQSPRTVSELEEGVVVTVASVPTKFVEYRIEREKIRSQKLDLLQTMLNDAELDINERQEMQGELISLMNNIAKETELENLLRVNGYLDAVVLIENDTATIVVPVTLSGMEAEMIGELVHRLTNIRFDRITIIDELTKS
ncbi:MAG TPA: SpoIIIAH-like family protein [Firmicutes bacterium]|nr:SpoIIIAH-like family protein [Bacillota bacterium]